MWTKADKGGTCVLILAEMPTYSFANSGSPHSICLMHVDKDVILLLRPKCLVTLTLRK